ncbi:MAG: glycogen synthase [Ignavibacteria bacterium]|nr:glycogen synthase [Ignavibacteria bacterium]
MKVCFITSECFPYVKTGGLADVSGSLPKALSELGTEVKIFLPLYDSADVNEFGIVPVKSLTGIPVRLGTKDVVFNVCKCKHPDTDIDVFFIDCPFYFKRGKIYSDDTDEDERFILFQYAVIMTLQLLKYKPDVIHCNDWQTALIPELLKTNFSWDGLFKKTKTLLTVHNIAYQGRFNKSSILKANLKTDKFFPFGPYEFKGDFNFLKCGIIASDAVNAVSPTYSKEIQTPLFGEGLEGILADKKDFVFGILNGIDDNIWNPKVDKFIFKNYTHRSLQNKIPNKIELLKRFNLKPDEKIPVFGIISRLAVQKGFDLMFPVIDKIMKENIYLIVLGSGEKIYEDFFSAAGKKYTRKSGIQIGYDNEMSHLITAGADFFLMPSKYEPCGLNQMYSLNYGTLPVVRKTGGLADTVIDCFSNPAKGNGISFDNFKSKEFLDAFKRALLIFENKEKMKKILRRGIIKDFSWKHSAGEYIELYSKL